MDRSRRSFSATAGSSRARPGNRRPGRRPRSGGEPGPITPGGDHGSPLSRGRPDCDRLASFDQHVLAASARLVVPTHDFKQPISFSRRGGVRGLRLLLRSPRMRVGGAPRNVRVQRHPSGVHITRHARRLARRLASHDAGRSPLGAPPWRFWAAGPRFSHRHLRRIGYSELLAPRS